MLADTFMHRYAQAAGKSITGFSPEAQHVVESYGWPGNVRELENVIERAVILEDGARVSVSSLPEAIVRGGGGLLPERADIAAAVAATVRPAATDEDPDSLTADDIVPLEEEERRIIRRALELTNWDAQQAAKRLRIGRATIYRKIERYGLRTAARR